MLIKAALNWFSDRLALCEVQGVATNGHWCLPSCQRAVYLYSIWKLRKFVCCTKLECNEAAKSGGRINLLNFVLFRILFSKCVTSLCSYIKLSINFYLLFDKTRFLINKKKVFNTWTRFGSISLYSSYLYVLL